MSRVAVVVLNYLNYKDTIECVDSILNMQYSVCGVVIVDNGSNNESYIKLKHAYKRIKTVNVIANKKNLGYAKGNNRGIAYARKLLGADFVLVVNNDTVFIDKNYIQILLEKYKPGVGVIGSKIILKNGQEQEEVKDCLEFKNYVSIYMNLLSLKHGSCFELPTGQGKHVRILHGSALLFTPDFFRFYRGFYRRTFLYGEEPILYLMCQCRKLRQVYVPDVKIYHKEDQSSQMSFQNDEIVLREYIFRSMKYIIWWIIRYHFQTYFQNCHKSDCKDICCFYKKEEK